MIRLARNLTTICSSSRPIGIEFGTTSPEGNASSAEELVTDPSAKCCDAVPVSKVFGRRLSAVCFC